MGKYINTINGVSLPAVGKAEVLKANGAQEIEQPKEFQENLVCVVNNGFFEAAGYCFNENEFKNFTLPTDYRPKTWLIVEDAEKLSAD